MPEKNMQKFETYKRLSEDLTKSLRAGFFYQAIFIEYAIFEDRLSSMLEHAGISSVNKKGNTIGISQKIKTVRTNKRFADKFVKDRITDQMLDDLIKWKDERNKLIHDMANMPYDSDAVRHVAEAGNELLKVFKSKSGSVIRHLEKEMAGK